MGCLHFSLGNSLSLPLRRCFWLLVCLALAGAAAAQQGAPAKTVLRVDSDEVAILRDSYGVPHVFAATPRGLFYGDGYAVAEDRLWQLEQYRRDAQGKLAEIQGREALARDREVRLHGYTAAELRAMSAALQPEERLIFEAYRDGVNAYIEQAVAKDALPEGFRKAGIRPAPWQVEDSISIGVMMTTRFGSGGGGEIRNLRIFNALKAKLGETEARKIFDDFFWINDPKSPTSITGEDMKRPPTAGGGGRPGGRRPLTERDMLGDEFSDPILADAQAASEMRETLRYAEAHRLPTKLGSYAWVIAPRRSASGNPLLVGGPQMGWMTPQIGHEVHLGGAGFNVIGMGFAGVPGVLIGHNADLAWTTTSGVADMTDIFVEKLDPKNKKRYRFKGEMRDMDCRTETIAVRGGEPAAVEVCRTVHGPVLEWDEKAGVAYSRAVSYRGHELDTARSALGFNRAKTVQEFARYVQLIWPSHNWLAADRHGNIGYWHGGKPPLRPPGQDPRFPLPGAGEAEWQGVQAFENMPQVINPARGYVVNWNNKPAPWTDNQDTPVWGEIFRIHRIQDLIEVRPKLTVEYLRQIIADIGLNDPNADYLKPHILDAIGRSRTEDAELLRAAEYLRAWDNHGEDQSVGKSIFDAWMTAIRVVLFKEEFGEVLDPSVFGQLLQPSLVLHLLEGEKSGVPPRHDYLKGRKHDDVVLDALRQAVAALQRKSPQMNAWGYQAPMNNRFKPLPPVPDTNRGTYIQIVELSTPVRGSSILPPGQSEDPRSPHFSDQLPLSSWWRFKPMVTDRSQLATSDK